MRSYVVNRCPHCRHSRLRLIASPTSESRESTTFRSWWPQYGHLMSPAPLHPVAKERGNVDVALVRRELRPLALERPALGVVPDLGRALRAEACGDDCDLDLALHGVVADDAEDDVGGGVGRRTHDLGRLLDLLQ